MASLTTSAGISEEMVRDLMVACGRASIRDQQGGASCRMVVRQRFGLHRRGHARHRNGLGPQALFHASALPESNGIAEAFVKTFKRDYARPSILPDAETLIAPLPAWFEDYNEVHPYSGSPGEFLRLSA
jgi:transposase InsO family protein